MTLAELNALAIQQGWAGGVRYDDGLYEVHHYPDPDASFGPVPYHVGKDAGELEIWLRANHCRDITPHLYKAYNPEAKQ